MLITCPRVGLVPCPPPPVRVASASPAAADQLVPTVHGLGSINLEDLKTAIEEARVTGVNETMIEQLVTIQERAKKAQLGITTSSSLFAGKLKVKGQTNYSKQWMP